MMKKFNDLLEEIVIILRRDYAGAERLGTAFDPRYYSQSIGQAWHDGRLDALLFLRHVSQMLAAVGDRHLRLTLCPSDSYTPWGPGFFTRRYGDSLYVTAVTDEPRLRPGDRITAINGGRPAALRAAIQKNFFYAPDNCPEREDWHGLLKMADSVTVRRGGGTFDLPLERHSPRPPDLAPCVRTLRGGAVYLRPGPFDGGGGTARLIEQYQSALRDAAALVLDLRGGRGEAEEDFLPLLPYVCRTGTPAAALLTAELFVNYTRLNCALKAAALADAPGGEEYIRELSAKVGRGLLPETDAPSGVIPGRAPGPVLVLTDTWCRDAAEGLVQAAKAAGAVLLGRPTLGTTDFCGDVSLQLDERFVLTWPTAITRAAREGRGMTGVGVVPDVVIPWTPEELRRDVLLDASLEHLSI